MITRYKDYNQAILLKTNAMLVLYDVMDFQIIRKNVFYLRVLVFFMNQNIFGRVVDFIQYKKIRDGDAQFENLSITFCPLNLNVS